MPNGSADSKLKKALSVFKKNPGDHATCNDIGDLYYEQNDFENALKYFKKARSLKPEEAVYIRNQASALENIDNGKEAASCFVKAGMAYYSADDFDLALKCYAKACELNAEKAHYWKKKGLALQALKRDSEAAAAFLKAAKIDPKDVDLLFNAAENGYFEVVKYCLKNGANSNARNDRKQTPLHLVVISKKLKREPTQEMVALFLSHGADISSQDSEGNSPLHVAVEKWDDVRLAKFLVIRGAKTQQKNSKDKTPAQLAKASGSHELCKWFELQERTIRHETRANQRFFDASRVQTAKNVDIKNKNEVRDLTKQFVKMRTNSKSEPILTEGISARRLVMADGAALKKLTQSYEPSDSMWQSNFEKDVLKANNWRSDGQEKLSKGDIIISTYKPVQGHVGNFFMKGIGDYGTGNTKYYNDPFVLTAIYEVTSKDSTGESSGKTEEKQLAKLLLNRLKDGAAITTKHLEKYDLYMHFDGKNPDEKRNAPFVKSLNRILVLTGIKEITRRMHGSRVVLPLATAYLKGLKLVSDGYLSMKDIFSKDAPYGLPTCSGLAANQETAKEKLMALNVLYAEKYPKNPLIKSEDFHQLMLEGYRGSSDTDGDVYSDSSDSQDSDSEDDEAVSMKKHKTC